MARRRRPCNILDFEEHFNGAKIVKLEQNYRSTAPILAVANAVISKRSDTKYKKRLFTEKLGGEKVLLGIAPSPEAEAAHVSRELRRIIREEDRKPKDCAILYRSNGQAKVLEEQLREQGVPYRMIGGQQFFERKEVKDLLAYLEARAEPRRRDQRSAAIQQLSAARHWRTRASRSSVNTRRRRAGRSGEAVERVDAFSTASPRPQRGTKAASSSSKHRRRHAEENDFIDAPACRESQIARDSATLIGLKKEIDRRPRLRTERVGVVAGATSPGHLSACLSLPRATRPR